MKPLSYRNLSCICSTLVVTLLLSACGGGGGGSSNSSPGSSGSTTTTNTTAADVATAKAFFDPLRSNINVLKADMASADVNNTGINAGVQTFQTSLSSELDSLGGATDFISLAQLATSFWNDYVSGATTNNFRSTGASSGVILNCRVMQGAVPAGLPTTGTLVAATSSANASWMNCSILGTTSLIGVTPQGSSNVPLYGRMAQNVLFKTCGVGPAPCVPLSTGTNPSAVAYSALTFKQTSTNPAFSSAVTTTLLTPTGVAGNLSVILNSSGDWTSLNLTGDLPPTATAAQGAANNGLLAAKYPVSLAGSLTTLPNGAQQIVLTSGSLQTTAVGSTTPSLTINLDDTTVGAATTLIVPADNSNSQQLASARLNVSASFADANGSIKGNLIADQFATDSSGSAAPKHLKFTGSYSVIPRSTNGTPGTLTTFLNGVLDYTNGTTPTATFTGSLNLPNRPVATLTASVTQPTSTQTTFTAQYVQNGLTTNINGTNNPPTPSSVIYSSSTGVSVTIVDGVTTANVTVSGRQAAVLNKSTNRITYADGSFTSIN